MRTIPLTIYNFDELPTDTAKQQAIDDYASHAGYVWAQEALLSLSRLAEFIGGTLKDYSIDWFNNSRSYATFEMPECDEEYIKSLLDLLGDYDPETLKGKGSCVLTGCCFDESAIDGFRKAFHNGERNIDRLMQAAFENWLKDVQSDCADSYTFEQFAENADANNMEFTEDGEIVLPKWKPGFRAA